MQGYRGYMQLHLNLSRTGACESVAVQETFLSGIATVVATMML